MTASERKAGRRPATGAQGCALSAILITHDEAKNLPDCLKSLAFCDEIIVVDNASTDETVAIAQQAGAKVVQVPDFPGFGPQKQRALEAASGAWILSIDADERIPEALAAEIRSVIASPAHAGYRINRKVYFLGHFLRHGGWHPDRVLRLARRDSARFSDDAVHERLEVSGTVGDLASEMLHFSYRSVDDVLTKQHRYALLSAAMRRERGCRGGVSVALSRSAFTFFKHYLMQRGFLDGSLGLVAAMAKAQECFWRYIAAGRERRDP